MTILDLPKPVIKSRQRNPVIEQQGLAAGLDPVIARIIAGRPIRADLPPLQALSPKLKQLDVPHSMMDMNKAAERIAQAIMQGECIGIETDHDCDGQTSHAVLHYNLINRFGHPAEKVRSYIGHRLIEGYGLSESVASRILADVPLSSLVITADNGSSDEPRLARLKNAGIDVIITDHHEIPIEGHPVSAYACLNPTREDCSYGDPYIAGCMVAWLLMAATRQQLIDLGYLAKETPSLIDSLDFVAVGTIADCVSIARSTNNRAVVSYGLQLIEKGVRPCWRAIKADLNRKITSEDLSFKIGPLLNSDGRLASALGSVSFLLTETDEEALEWIASLRGQNEERKLIQKTIVQQGLHVASKQVIEGRFALCIYLPEGHPGVHGIAASRIKELFGRPTAFFAPKAGNQNLITGSVRGLEGFHVRDALQMVANQNPNLLIAFGGHVGAGGLTLKAQDFEAFSFSFEAATRQQLSSESIGPVIWTDGELSAANLNLKFLDKLSLLEPFGREFESPLFETEATLKQLRVVGDGTHARVLLEIDGLRVSGIWFGMRQSEKAPMPVIAGERVKVVYSLRENLYQGNRSLDVLVNSLTSVR